MHHEVIIVGAGPGGSAAALALAQRGVKDVLLLDRDPFARHLYESLHARMFQDFRIREHRILAARAAYG